MDLSRIYMKVKKIWVLSVLFVYMCIFDLKLRTV